MKVTISLITTFFLLLTGCVENDSVEPANWIFKAGAIFTAERTAPYAEAIAIRKDRIVYVGDESGVLPYIGDNSRVVNIGEGLLIPGFMDSHSHIFMGSFADVGVNLSLADTHEKLQVALETIRDKRPEGEPIYGRGWQNHLFPKSGPLATHLDLIFGSRIVILTSVDGHSTWFSSKALEEAGVDANFKDPKPGVSFFERDPITNVPLGTAREGAGAFIRTKFIPGDKDAYRDRLQKWLPRASIAGLTSIFDAAAAAPTEENAYSILSELEAQGQLTLRVFGSVLQVGPATDTAVRFEKFKNTYSSEMARPEAIKIVADGVPEGHTAYLLTPYVDSTEEDFGHPMMSRSSLASQIKTYFEAGIPIHIHAIGGAAVRMSLDAIELARQVTDNKTVRATIAHMDFVHADDIPRFKELNVNAQTSIQWAARDPSYFNIGSFVGIDKVEGAYPVRSIIDSGANQTFGADWPASAYLSTYKPLELIEVAISRRLPGIKNMPARNLDQSITIEEAIIAMTRNTAIQVGELENLGTLTEGKLADLVLLDQNLFEIQAEKISSVPVRLTMVNGEMVYEK